MTTAQCDINKVITLFQNAFTAAGLKTTKKIYGLSPDGHKMLVVWRLDNNVSGKTAYVLGVWNSIDKSIALGIVIVAGTKILARSNFVFSGDFIRSQRHTRGTVIDSFV